MPAKTPKETIDVSSIADPLSGHRLPGNTLEEVVNSGSIVILHFLRQLGCRFCKHSVDQIRKFAAENPNFPEIIFVHQGDKQEGDAFFQEFYPNAPHIADPKLKLFRLFKIPVAPMIDILHPVMIWRAIKLTLMGYPNEQKGNPRILSGTFLFFNGKLAWSHRAKIAGDEPNWSKLKVLVK